MYVSELTTFQYRNLRDATITLPKGIISISGRNAHGKTNLVESIYFLATGKSFRTAQSKELSAHGVTESAVHGVIGNGDRIGITIENGKKRFLLSGEPRPWRDVLGRLVVVVFSPLDLELIKGTSLERRKFIDRHCVDSEPQFLNSVLRYEKALKEKNAILKKGIIPPDPRDISSWNQVIAAEAAIIQRKRRDFIDELNCKVKAIYRDLHGNDGEANLHYEPGIKDLKNEDSTPEEIFNLLERNCQKEIARGHSIIGTHRDDIVVSINGRDSRRYASQGQARSLALSLKLGSVELIEKKRGETPIILLDDFESELDEVRREAIFTLVLEKKGQVFMTGTAVQDRFATRSVEPALRLIVQEGRVTTEG